MKDELLWKMQKASEAIYSWWNPLLSAESEPQAIRIT